MNRLTSKTKSDVIAEAIISATAIVEAKIERHAADHRRFEIVCQAEDVVEAICDEVEAMNLPILAARREALRLADQRTMFAFTRRDEKVAATARQILVRAFRRGENIGEA